MINRFRVRLGFWFLKLSAALHPDPTVGLIREAYQRAGVVFCEVCLSRYSLRRWGHNHLCEDHYQEISKKNNGVKNADPR